MNVPAVLRRLAQAIDDGEGWVGEPYISVGIPHKYGGIEISMDLTVSFIEGVSSDTMAEILDAIRAERTDPLPGIPK